jgi:hypothetical protein
MATLAEEYLNLKIPPWVMLIFLVILSFLSTMCIDLSKVSTSGTLMLMYLALGVFLWKSQNEGRISRKMRIAGFILNSIFLGISLGVLFFGPYIWMRIVCGFFSILMVVAIISLTCIEDTD